MCGRITEKKTIWHHNIHEKDDGILITSTPSHTVINVFGENCSFFITELDPLYSNCLLCDQTLNEWNIVHVVTI